MHGSPARSGQGHSRVIRSILRLPPRIRYGFIAFDRFLSIDKNRRQNMINLLTGVGLARAQAPDSRVAGEEVNEID